VVFGPKPRSYITSLNKKERRAAFVAALSERFQSGCVTILATEGFDLAKTRDLAALLFGSAKAAKTGDRTLIVYAQTEAEPLGCSASP
jgi:ribosomal protein L4